MCLSVKGVNYGIVLKSQECVVIYTFSKENTYRPKVKLKLKKKGIFSNLVVATYPVVVAVGLLTTLVGLLVVLLVLSLYISNMTLGI